MDSRVITCPEEPPATGDGVDDPDISTHSTEIHGDPSRSKNVSPSHDPPSPPLMYAQYTRPGIHDKAHSGPIWDLWRHTEWAKHPELVRHVVDTWAAEHKADREARRMDSEARLLYARAHWGTGKGAM